MVYVLSSPVYVRCMIMAMFAVGVTMVHAIKMKIRAARGKSQNRRSSTGPARYLRELGLNLGLKKVENRNPRRQRVESN